MDENGPFIDGLPIKNGNICRVFLVSLRIWSPKNPGHGNVDVFKCNTHFMFKLHPQFDELYHVVSKNNPKTSWLLPAQKVIETQPQIFNNIQHKPFRASRALPDEFVHRFSGCHRNLGKGQREASWGDGHGQGSFCGCALLILLKQA